MIPDIRLWRIAISAGPAVLAAASINASYGG
jgi:hypothetical protein